VGHPTEADRALKMETAYAGRTWLYRGRDRNQLGQRIASDLVTAFSDPSLPGLGRYDYDDEGMPGRRVVHIDRGIFRGFMNSRRTAGILGAEPNGHAKVNRVQNVPLVRMSSTCFAGGESPPAEILAGVEEGYYLVGMRTPSIAESRENFRISARLAYEVRGGKVGRLLRSGSMTADSRDWLLSVDAVGDDFKVYPVLSCGKGQPMQTKRLGNGAPTMRGRARVVGPEGR